MVYSKSKVRNRLATLAPPFRAPARDARRRRNGVTEDSMAMTVFSLGVIVPFWVAGGDFNSGLSGSGVPTSDPHRGYRLPPVSRREGWF